MSGPKLVLVGPPGAGKTTVGELVAKLLDTDFRDTDRDIEAGVGKSIADIFLEDGEAGFRALERAAVAAALQQHQGVLALGGGAVMDPSTQQLLTSHRVVFLDVGLTAAVQRTGMNNARPLLAVNPRATMKAMLDERRETYESLAFATVVTDSVEPMVIAEQVVALL